MMALFDQQKAVEQFGYEKMKEGEEKGKLEQDRESALNMKKEGLPDSTIARVLNVGLELVQQWLSGAVAAKP